MRRDAEDCFRLADLFAHLSPCSRVLVIGERVHGITVTEEDDGKTIHAAPRRRIQLAAENTKKKNDDADPLAANTCAPTG
jgi:hypothetical protein